MNKLNNLIDQYESKIIIEKRMVEEYQKINRSKLVDQIKNIFEDERKILSLIAEHDLSENFLIALKKEGKNLLGRRTNFLEHLKNIDQQNKMTKDCESLYINVFVKPHMDTFIKQLLYQMSQSIQYRINVIENTNQISSCLMKNAINWFEWCDDLVLYASKLKNISNYKLLCRIHSYELFATILNKVKWSNVDKVILISEYGKHIFNDRIDYNQENIHVLPNPIQIENYTYREHKHGNKIGYIGYLNYKKGVTFLINVFKEILHKLPEKELYIAGEFQDESEKKYFFEMAKRLNIDNNIFFCGWQDNLDKWLDNINYAIVTSVFESQNISVMEAMCKGVKPLIHNFFGSEMIFKKDYIWSSIDDLVKMLSHNSKYDSYTYRSFIKNNYSNVQIVKKYGEILNEM